MKLILKMDSSMLDEEKLQLFDSADDEEKEEENDDFRIRPQYQGPHGLEILETNAQLSKRFKLDERFTEDFEPGGIKKSGIEESPEANEEKKKNIRILETILGHGVNAKSSVKTFIKKQQIRFDPEDENAVKFIKAAEKTSEKPNRTKKEVSEEKVDVIPTSAERYIEVCSNLKEILNASTPFSFSQKFNPDMEVIADSKNESTFQLIDQSNNKKKNSETKKEDKLKSQTKKSSIDPVVPKSKWNSFFVIEGDPRFKDGIEFFRRPKPLEEIRTEWQKRRASILELFRRKRRTSHQSQSTRIQSAQLKNTIRKHDFRK